jgi:UDP-glucose 4-epimerase
VKILVTGGAGYIGSHTLIALLEAENQVAVIDNYSNSSEAILEQVERITGHLFEVHNADVTVEDRLNEILGAFQPDIVIHFAGRKSVTESVERPDFYYQQNVEGTQNLLNAMDVSGCRHIIFSSSAAVYGVPEHLPITEKHPLAPFNPYGASKQAAEEAITTWVNKGINAGGDRSAVLLRYFNPAGAHSSGQIGENPKGRPDNLFPYIMQVAAGIRSHLDIYGDDYDTPDGTGVRDYIHINDLVKGHIAALHFAEHNSGVEIYNLGAGRGYSVAEVVATFEAAIGQSVRYQVKERRAGDIASCYADPARAQAKLGWTAEKTLEQMCRDGWRWQVGLEK